MSRSSAPEDSVIGSPPDDRGVVEPTAALVATVAVCLAVSLYAGALDEAVPAVERNVAEPTLQQVQESLTAGGVIHPGRLPLAKGQGPAGYDLNVTVSAADRRWHLGPPVPDGGRDGWSGGSAGRVDRAGRRVSVVVGPGVVRRGALEVAVWT